MPPPHDFEIMLLCYHFYVGKGYEIDNYNPSLKLINFEIRAKAILQIVAAHCHVPLTLTTDN
jgi:hypothetical protein